MLTISIQRDLFARFPNLTVGGFVVTNLEAATAALSDPTLEAAWAAAREELARRGVSIENVANLSIVHDWRVAFTACGVKPSTFKSSVEALMRRTLKDGSVNTPIPVVTLYCAVSTRHLAPLGGYDIDNLPEPTMILRSARPPSDTFEPLGGRASDMPLDARIAVYGSGDLVACYLFNHRDSKPTCLRATTSRALFVGEAVTAEQLRALENALDAMREHLAAHGAHIGATRFVSNKAPEAVLEFAPVASISEVQ